MSSEVFIYNSFRRIFSMRAPIMVLLLLIFLGVLGASAPIIYDQGAGATDGSSIIQSGDLTVEIWDSPTGGSLIYSNTFVGAIRNGSWVVELDLPSDFEYGRVYYKDYQIDGVDLDFDGNERLPWMSPLGIINSSWIDNSTVQLRVSGTCPAGFAIDSINQDGTVNCVSISGSVEIGYNETGDDWLYNDSSGHVLYFNETKFNETLALKVDNWGFVNETGDLWLNISNHIIMFNETLLNDTIDNRTNYTNGTGLWLNGKIFQIMECPNADDVLSWDGSKWVCSSVSSLAQDTQKNASGPWLWNNSETIFFNESYWAVRTNESVLAFNWLNGTLGNYLYVVGRNVGFDENLLNSTIKQLIVDYGTVNASVSDYLNITGNFIDFNETLLNNTIDLRSNYTNGTGISIIGKTISIISCPNAGEVLSWDGSKWVCSAAAVDTQKAGEGPWLYNDSIYIKFNVTHYESDLDSKGYVNESVSEYLDVNSHQIDFNETRLNSTILSFNWLNGTIGSYLYTVGRDIGLDENVLNSTILSNLVSYNAFNSTGSSFWLNSSGNIVDLNESKLDDYLSDYLSTRDYVNNSVSDYLNISGNDIDFNETKLNDTIDAKTYWNLTGTTLHQKDLSANVGIGTDTASEKLEVNGTIKVDDPSSTKSAKIYVDSNGNLIFEYG